MTRVVPKRPCVALLALAAASLTACASGARGGPDPAPYEVRGLGEPYTTPAGEVFLIRVQDEYRLIRCIPTGPIAGCYEDVLALPRGGVPWNEWMPVDTVAGLHLAFLSPDVIALRHEPPAVGR
jgi:hypothetical protein